MADKEILPLSDEEIQSRLKDLPDWELRDGWIRRAYTSPGWPHTLMLVNAIGYRAEAAFHHPDLEVGWARVVVKLQTHSAKGITVLDFELAKEIEEIATWMPDEESSFSGFPKKWVR